MEGAVTLSPAFWHLSPAHPILSCTRHFAGCNNEALLPCRGSSWGTMFYGSGTMTICQKVLPVVQFLLPILDYQSIISISSPSLHLETISALCASKLRGRSCTCRPHARA